MTLPADESSTAVNPGVSVFIPIFDDEVDEADEQDFSVSLDVVDATNRDLIRTSPSVASCSIIDNDGKCIACEYVGGGGGGGVAFMGKSGIRGFI